MITKQKYYKEATSSKDQLFSFEAGELGSGFVSDSLGLAGVGDICV